MGRAPGAGHAFGASTMETDGFPFCTHPRIQIIFLGDRGAAQGRQDRRRCEASQ